MLVVVFTLKLSMANCHMCTRVQSCLAHDALLLRLSFPGSSSARNHAILKVEAKTPCWQIPVSSSQLTKSSARSRVNLSGCCRFPPYAISSAPWTKQAARHQAVQLCSSFASWTSLRPGPRHVATCSIARHKSQPGETTVARVFERPVQRVPYMNAATTVMVKLL
ncbi:hypothetical protein COO60DRAFT_370896 [Scenedesmus sp. NREL 46B-D3]|nr:hypothetical protein COO60DRAFT_370896 [Scenedesmus sp. NREL 46B-D3]